jgi:hypothetical protein
MIASALCSSFQDNTAYIVTQLPKDLKARLLPEKYHVVLMKLTLALSRRCQCGRGEI